LKGGNNESFPPSGFIALFSLPVVCLLSACCRQADRQTTLYG